MAPSARSNTAIETAKAAARRQRIGIRFNTLAAARSR